jgi:hypothetical protein
VTQADQNGRSKERRKHSTVNVWDDKARDLERIP